MKKRIVSVMLCAAMGVSLFTGACVVEAKADGKDKIVVWMKKDLTDVANNMFKERCEQFAEENDVDVEVEVIAYEDFYTKWAAAIESGNLPDLSYFGYQEMGQYYSQGILEDMTDVYNEINDVTPFEESLAPAVTSEDGVVYGFLDGHLYRCYITELICLKKLAYLHRKHGMISGMQQSN